MRRLWIALGILFTLLVAVVIGLAAWVHAYLRSEAFRQLVSAKTGQALRIDATYEPFDWAGATVYSASLKGPGAEGGSLETLGAEQVRANLDWKAIFDGVWRISEVDVVRLDVTVRTGGEQAADVTEPPSGPAPSPRRNGFLPDRFQLDLVSVQDANFVAPDGSQLRHTALKVRPEGGGWIFDGTRGTLELAGWPVFDVDDFRLRSQQGVAYLTSAGLRFGETGTIQVSGEVGGANAPYDLRVEWRGVDSSKIVDKEWKDRLTGTLSGDAHIVGRAKMPPLTTGRFLLTDGLLEGLPAQKEIAKFTQSPQFERMPLQTMSGDCTYDGATLVVKKFVAESQGLLRVEGDCVLGPGDAVAGTFEVGVTSQSLQWLPGSREKVFVTSRDGYLWTTVRVGGTRKSPTEDLSSRLATAMGEQVIDTGVQLLQGAPTKATDAVDKALDILVPLIP